MLHSLARFKFVDRHWDSQTLDHLAEFWLRLFDKVDNPPHEPWESDQLLELRLTGFTRSAAKAVSDELARCLHDSGVPVRVSIPDPDTLVAKTKQRDGSKRPFPGL